MIVPKNVFRTEGSGVSKNSHIGFVSSLNFLHIRSPDHLYQNERSPMLQIV
uniref:Uncharacterized protein n=1 Tax=Octopus bimaculoides TaxID=37653 RepID=A0A0L8HW44_OCTBM